MKKVEINEIGNQMAKSGLPEGFVSDAVDMAFEFEGIQDLLIMWYEENDEKERTETIKVIQDLINDWKS